MCSTTYAIKYNHVFISLFLEGPIPWKWDCLSIPASFPLYYNDWYTEEQKQSWLSAICLYL